MVHQYEEHDGDRIRPFLNRTIGKKCGVLSPLAVFIINVPGVRGVMALSFYAAVAVNPGRALIAVDLVLVNAFVHIVHALIFRRDNPGLATVLEQGASLLLAIAIHAASLIHVRRLGAMQQARADRRG